MEYFFINNESIKRYIDTLNVYKYRDLTIPYRIDLLFQMTFLILVKTCKLRVVLESIDSKRCHNTEQIRTA
jgi:hypothetical protein